MSTKPPPVKKRKIRELALQVLFAWDAQGAADVGPDQRELASRVTHDGSDDPVVRQRAVDMATGTWGYRATSDAWVERIAPQWPPRRQPAVDRSLVRLAVYEMTHTDTPPKVVLDEAIELAKQFSTQDSAAFVNGVLDAVLREHHALITPPPQSTT